MMGRSEHALIGFSSRYNAVQVGTIIIFVCFPSLDAFCTAAIEKPSCEQTLLML
jgi:hypothetical protein